MKKILLVNILLCILLVISGCSTRHVEVIGHRQNTLPQIASLAQAGVNRAEVDVQLTKDHHVVLFHPDNLNDVTPLSGAVCAFDYAVIRQAHFKSEDGNHLQALYIPTLDEVLTQYPQMKFIIDFKALPAQPLVEAVVRVVDKHQAWKRVVFYSTDSTHVEALLRLKSDAVVFEDRRTTRTRLLNVVARQHCMLPSPALWIGFEHMRPLRVTETFKLGEQSDELPFVMWTKDSLACTRQQAPHANVVWFGVNTLDQYKEAEAAGADGVFCDSPSQLGHLE